MKNLLELSPRELGLMEGALWASRELAPDSPTRAVTTGEIREPQLLQAEAEAHWQSTDRTPVVSYRSQGEANRGEANRLLRYAQGFMIGARHIYLQTLDDGS